MKFPSVEIEKRERDERTETLIKSLLDEEKVSKKQKKGPTPANDSVRPAIQARKGKTFSEIEAEEGGPIKESLVGMAHAKRALDRKKREVDVGDTDVVTNTERYEKDTLDVEQEDGITFEPFNLKQEREEGYFDEDGNYVLRKQAGEEGEDEKDAWLNSDEAKVVSNEVRRRIEEQRARAEEAARRAPLTERQIAQRKADIAAMMRTGETVSRALKRLGSSAGAAGGVGAAAAAGLPHRAMGKRERARLLAQQQQQGTGAGAMADATGESTAREQFSRMTEVADELLAEGELEIYDATQEELLRSARMWLPQLAAAPAQTSASAGGAASMGDGSAAAKGDGGDDDDDDMFADEDERTGAEVKGAVAGLNAQAAVDHDQDMFADDDDAEATGSGRNGQGAADAVIAAVGVTSATATGKAAGVSSGGESKGLGVQGSGAAWSAAAAPEGQTRTTKEGAEVVDYASWPIKELKRLLQERGVDSSGIVEKADLVAKVKEIVDGAGTSGSARGGAGAGGESSFVAPAGYVFDPSSGYFYSEDAGMFYDPSTGGYCQTSSGKWFYLDAGSGAFVEWKQ